MTYNYFSNTQGHHGQNVDLDITDMNSQGPTLSKGPDINMTTVVGTHNWFPFPVEEEENDCGPGIL